MFVGTFLYAGSVKATISEIEVVKGDPVLLTITVVGSKSDSLPNIKEIAGVPVIGITRGGSSSYIHVNGQSKMEHTQTLTLEFVPERNMTIPAFQLQVDGVIKSTDVIELIVIDKVTGAKKSNVNFSLAIKSSKSKVYLGESFLITVYFKQRTIIDLMHIDYHPPAFKDFFNKQVGKEKTHTKDGYGIHELTYLLTAKREGNLTVEFAHARVAERNRQRQLGGWYTDSPKWSNIRSQSMDIEVINANVAHDIVGEFTLNEAIDSLRVEGNKPVNLQVELMGEGNLEDYDGIKFDIPNVTIYSDDAKVETQFTHGKLKSRYLKSFVFIADHNFTIPSYAIRVFNYKTGKLKRLQTKEYKIEVKSGTNMASVPVVHTKQALTLKSENREDVTESNNYKMKIPSFSALAIAFALGAIALFVIQTLLHYLPSITFGKWKSKKTGFTGHDALKILYPYVSESKEVEEMVRQLYAIKSGEKGIEIDRKSLNEMVANYQNRVL